MKYKFNYVEDDRTGGEGFLLEGFDNFDPARGQGIAHDILEHPPLSVCSNPIANELMAFGAIVYTRYENGHDSVMSFGSSFERLMGRSIVSLIQDNIFMSEDYQTLETAPKTLPMRMVSDKYFTRSVTEALEQLKEWGVDPDTFTDEYDYEDDDDYNIAIYQFIKERYTDIVSWLRLGYRYAKKRYWRQYDQYNVMALFNYITNAMNEVEREAEIGDTVILSVNYTTREVEVTIDRSDDYW